MLHISDNMVPSIITVNVVCLTIACIAVALRFQARRMIRIRYEADDWLILVGLVRRTGFFVFRSMIQSYVLLCMTYNETYPLIVLTRTVFHNWTHHLRFSRYGTLAHAFLITAYNGNIGVRYGAGRHAILIKNPPALAKVRICDRKFPR